MPFVKTCWGIKGNMMVSIRTNFYCSDLEYIQTLVVELRKDFPQALDKEITVVVYNNQSFKGMTGIEYFTQQSVPNEYFEYDVAPCKF